MSDDETELDLYKRRLKDLRNTVLVTAKLLEQMIDEQPSLRNKCMSHMMKCRTMAILTQDM